MFVSVCAATGRAIVCGSSCFVITIGEIRKRLDPELFFLSLWRNDTHSENHWKNMSHLISMPVWHGLPSRLPLWRQLLQSESCKFHSFFEFSVFALFPPSIWEPFTAKNALRVVPITERAIDTFQPCDSFFSRPRCQCAQGMVRDANGRSQHMPHDPKSVSTILNS